MKNDPSVPPEEKEEWCLTREREADAINDYTKVERVISIDEDQAGDTKYYVKCTYSRTKS